MSPVTTIDVLIAALIGVAVYTDVRTSLIPNVLTFTGMAVGIVLHVFYGDWSGGILGIVAAFLPGFLFWRLGNAWGAGDVKLLMAAGALLGDWRESLRLVFFVILVSIPFGLWKLWRMGRLKSFFNVLKTGIRKEAEGPKPASTPFAVAIAVAWIAFRLLPGWPPIGLWK